jgi:NAD(P)-dependent dehydrogenase (short-subunit alcohol dehydrogenase family)
MQDSLLAYVPSPNAFQDQVFLITGAGAGLGRAIAIASARFGATVVLLDKEVRRLEEVYDEIMNTGYAEPAIYPLDMQGATAKDYADLAENIQQQLGRLDGIVLNAAWLAAFTPMAYYETEMWSKMIMVNLHANVMLTQACLHLLQASPNASMTLVDHISNKAYFGAFGVAKAGMRAYCDIMAAEHDNLQKFIRINTIEPGAMRTSFRTLHYPGENPNETARPEALVGPFLYFLSSDADKRTGEHIVIPSQAANATWLGETHGA